MKHIAFIVIMVLFALPTYANSSPEELQNEVKKLKQVNHNLKVEISQLKNKKPQQQQHRRNKQKNKLVHTSPLGVHVFNGHPESLEFYPTALMADNHIVTYIAGTPIVASPFLGSRPAFDGSDYIVNISSINRDIRLMQQRRRLYNAYKDLNYPAPNTPIIALSGSVVPAGAIGRNYFQDITSDWNLGSSELDVAAALNDMVEGYIALAYDNSPPTSSRQRVSNSALYLNMGFINIGNLDKSPLYLTAGQLYVPFGRFSSAMISAPLTTMMARTQERPFILGYKSQTNSGPFAAIYAFKGDTTLGGSAVGGINLGYIFENADMHGEIGASFISSIDDAVGMQFTGSTPGTTFGGFASIPNGNEDVKKIPALGAHATFSVDRYNLTAEWIGVTKRFRLEDLSFNGEGANPQAAQLEAGVTFMAWNRPSSVALSYQWAQDTLALNIPKERINAVFNISIWKDTVESLEFCHDKDYKATAYANGAAPPGLTNANTLGTGKTANKLIVQIAVYF